MFLNHHIPPRGKKIKENKMTINFEELGKLESKKLQKEKLDRDVQKYLDNGGKITVYPPCKKSRRNDWMYQPKKNNIVKLSREEYIQAQIAKSENNKNLVDVEKTYLNVQDDIMEGWAHHIRKEDYLFNLHTGMPVKRVK